DGQPGQRAAPGAPRPARRGGGTGGGNPRRPREDGMTDDTLPTEPLRAEHRDLLPHLRALDTAADEVDQWDRDEATHVLGEILDFLRGHLVPHATAEEHVLYPAVEQ